MAKVDAQMQEFLELARALKELEEFFEFRGYDYCLIGGLAAIHWGEPRFTQDVDVVVVANLGEEEPVIDALLGKFSSRLKASEARQFALDNRVLLLKSNSGVPIDISLGALGFEQQMIHRARRVTAVRGTKFRMATAEDIVVMKTIAGRHNDWRDIEGIIAKRGEKLDWSYIHGCLRPLLETLEHPERFSQLDAIRNRIESSIGSHKKAHGKTRRSSTKRKK
jgi:hypothetical protein